MPFGKQAWSTDLTLLNYSLSNNSATLISSTNEENLMIALMIPSLIIVYVFCRCHGLYGLEII